MLMLRFFNLFAFLLGSVIMDIEPLILIFAKKCYLCPHHGFFHSVLGAVVGSIIVALILIIFGKPLEKLSLKLRLKQSWSLPVLFLSSFSVWLLHIFLDSLMHSDVFPFWPSHWNPILIGPKTFWPLHIILFVFGVLGLIWFYKYYVRHKPNPPESQQG